MLGFLRCGSLAAFGRHPRTGKKARERRHGFIGRLFREEMAARHARALGLRREAVAPCRKCRRLATREIELARQHEHGAGDLATGLEIGLVGLDVERGACPIILAKGVNPFGLAGARVIMRQGARVEDA